MLKNKVKVKKKRNIVKTFCRRIHNVTLLFLLSMQVVCMQTMIFELELLRYRARGGAEARRGSHGARSILLRGPIYLLEEIDALIFLCSPMYVTYKLKFKCSILWKPT